jgi:glyoxylase-like metal-dependent hydrolase (beta-lactamase superfamily II)
VQISAPHEPPDRAFPPGVQLVKADNPGPMTLAGTNTWILAGEAAGQTVVIDPGPVLEEHLDGIRALGRPTAIVLTHRHLDHSEAAAALATEFDIPVFAALPELAIGTRPLVDGDEVEAAGWLLRVVATPGHTSDSVCLVIEQGTFTGDTLLGGSTTVIAPPSGSLAEYFSSMKKLEGLGSVRGFPGHGPSFSNVGAWARQNVEYREQRLAQLVSVYSRLREFGTPTIGAVASAAYGVDGGPVTEYVEAMTAAQLTFLAERGDIA